MTKSSVSMISRTNFVVRNSQGHIEKSPGKAFSRLGIPFDPVRSLEREARVLSLLGGEISPRLLNFSKATITMEFVGDTVSLENLPRDYADQVQYIVSFLKQVGVVHRDIKRDNLMVHRGRLKLIDFGWALDREEPFYVSPIELSFSKNPLAVYSNGFGLKSTIAKIIRGRK